MERTTKLLTLVAALAVVAVGLSGCLTNASTPNASTSGNAPATVYQSIVIGTLPSATGDQLDAFIPANVTVPANTTVVFTITNYDDGANPVAPSLADVEGTVGNSITVDGGSPVSSVDNTTVSHTFSITTGPGGEKVNVPIPAASDNGQGGIVPSVVTFSVTVHGPGSYTWYCYAPCDPASMGRLGLMAGHLTVVA